MGEFVKHMGCVDCNSTDSLAIYYSPEDGTLNGTCWGVCKAEDGKGYKSHNKLANSYLADELGIKPITRKYNPKQEEVKVSERVVKRTAKKKADIITKEQINKIKANTSPKGKNFRGIKDNILAKFKVLTAYDEETGGVSDRYYPITLGKDEDGKPKLVGYQRRFVIPEKDFISVGLNIKECELFGQWLCKGTGKLVLTGGPEDTLASTMVFSEYRESRGKDKIAPIDFVSGTVGETSLAAQIRHNYDFVDRYDEIIIDMDSDKAGDKATEALLEVLPLHKVKIMSYSCKDANEALEKGCAKEYVSAIYNAKRPVVAGIHGSSTLVQDMLNDFTFEKLPLPAFMNKVNEMFEGGYDFGTFNIIAGDTSIGKSTIVNEISSHVIECGDYKPVILSLEAKRSVLAKQYLSLKLGKRLNTFKTKEELASYLNQHEQDVQDFMQCGGENTFEVIDDRARLASVEDTFKMLERAIIGLNCRVVILDVLTDLTDSLTTEQQALFNGKIKAMIAKHNVCIIAVCHTRKLEGTAKDGKPRIEPTRFDIYGSKTTINSATSILLVWRDLQHEDEQEKNTTYSKVDKNRDHSLTGPSGVWYYVRDKHRMVDKTEWVKSQGRF